MILKNLNVFLYVLKLVKKLLDMLFDDLCWIICVYILID